jgi:hypothetical protein
VSLSPEQLAEQPLGHIQNEDLRMFYAAKVADAIRRL